MKNEIDFEQLKLLTGKHKSIAEGACVMEMVSYLAGELWSDHPKCACPTLTTYAIQTNDRLNDEDRQKLKPFIPRLINTRNGKEKERAEFFAHAAITRILPILTDALDLPEISARFRSFKIGEWNEAKKYIDDVKPQIRKAATAYATAAADYATAAAYTATAAATAATAAIDYANYANYADYATAAAYAAAATATAAATAATAADYYAAATATAATAADYYAAATAAAYTATATATAATATAAIDYANYADYATAAAYAATYAAADYANYAAADYANYAAATAATDYANYAAADYATADPKWKPVRDAIITEQFNLLDEAIKIGKESGE